MNKYEQMINIDNIKLGDEFMCERVLYKAVGLPQYNGQLQQWKMQLAVQKVLATKGLTFKKLKENSFKVTIVAL